MVYKHGLYKTRLYRIWYGMKSRCYYKKDINYKNYGQRGICIEWDSFESFIRDMQPSYVEGFQIERINNNKNYCKENCKWIPQKEQSLNKRNNVKFKGQCASVVSKRLGGDTKLISGRIKKGWSKEKAFTTPKIGKSKDPFLGETTREASLRLGGSVGLVNIRLESGWSVEKAFTTPVRKKLSKKFIMDIK